MTAAPAEESPLTVTLEVVPADEAAAGEFARAFALVLHEWGTEDWTAPDGTRRRGFAPLRDSQATYTYRDQEYACGPVTPPTRAEAAAVTEAIRAVLRGEI